MNTEEQIKVLEDKIAMLESKINNLGGYNTLPKDLEDALVARGFLKFDGSVTFDGGASGNTSEYIFAKYNTKRSLIYVDNAYIPFSVNVSTDLCYASNHPFSNEQQVLLYTTDTLPAGLSSAISYYIKNATADTFQLSSDDVSIDNITSTGTGIHYAVFFT